MKRMITLFMILVLAVTFAGCGSDSGSDGGNGDTAGSSNEENVKNSEPIQIATKPMTEQYILGEMLKLLIENDTDYTVEITKGIGGGTSNIQPAMEKGEFDLYPEYTSSGWMLVLGHDGEGMDDDQMFEDLKAEYEESYNMSWVGLYGFNNTFAVAVRKEVADKYQLKTTSDLAAVAGELVFGGNPDYIEREDGFGILCETYGLEFKEVKDIDIGLKYEAMEHGDIDVTNAFTTDAQLSRDDVTVLEDDKHLQLNYFCSTVVRNEALEEYPGLYDVLMKMDGLLRDKEMAALNYQVEVEGKDEAEVARDYLVEKDLIK